jgi:hypothetical protein
LASTPSSWPAAIINRRKRMMSESVSESENDRRRRLAREADIAGEAARSSKRPPEAQRPF